ncbi:MAG: hypothetical protein IJ819_11645 [Clostridiales bacterium]|nr:hypothetical protein [Clostridiales bacterium]
MVIIWAAPLAVCLKRLIKKPIRIQKLSFSDKDFVKRIGVYYMCIDDLPL